MNKLHRSKGRLARDGLPGSTMALPGDQTRHVGAPAVVHRRLVPGGSYLASRARYSGSQSSWPTSPTARHGLGGSHGKDLAPCRPALCSWELQLTLVPTCCRQALTTSTSKGECTPGKHGSQQRSRSWRGAVAVGAQSRLCGGTLREKRTHWMVCRLQQKTGMILRFAIGEVPPEHEAAIAEEEKACGAFLRIPIEKV